MSDQKCNCVDGAEHRETDHDGHDGRWITGQDVLEEPLPADLAGALGRLLGRGSVDTIDEWIAEVRRHTGGGAISVADLCHEGGETAHWGELDGERYYFACFYDAVILAALADESIEIHTESPDGEAIEAHAADSSDLTVTPESAVFSFGVAADVGSPPGGAPTHADVYAAVCPYVRAFPNRDSYREWATDVPAATVAMPLSGTTELADALVE